MENLNLDDLMDAVQSGGGLMKNIGVECCLDEKKEKEYYRFTFGRKVFTVQIPDDETGAVDVIVKRMHLSWTPYRADEVRRLDDGSILSRESFFENLLRLFVLSPRITVKNLEIV